MDTSVNLDLKNGAFGGNYGFHFNDGKIILIDIVKNDIGEPTFKFSLQDTKTGKTLDNLEISTTVGHEWFKVVK